jgi:hypothetical protein
MSRWVRITNQAASGSGRQEVDKKQGQITLYGIIVVNSPRFTRLGKAEDLWEE